MNLINSGAKLASLFTDIFEKILSEFKIFTDVKAYRDEIARYEGQLRQNAPQVRIEDAARRTAVF